MTYSRRYLRLAAFACLAVAVAGMATLIPALFNPPPWNRADRAVAVYAWFYVGYLHWRLAGTLPDPAATKAPTVGGEADG